MRRRVDSDGSSVTLNGIGKVLTNPGRGRKGRVHKFNRFNRTKETVNTVADRGAYQNWRP